MSNPDTYVQPLEAAVEALNREEAANISHKLIAALGKDEQQLPAKAASWFLGTLRRKRYFSEMVEVADALLASGQEAPIVRRQSVQALIDQGQLWEAQGDVEDLISDVWAALRKVSIETPKDVWQDLRKEYDEARGLRGRILKQMYIDTMKRPYRTMAKTQRAHEALRRAVRYYFEVYNEEPVKHYWHGINVVACMARAKRDNVPIQDTLIPWSTIAQSILNQMKTLWLSDKKKNPYHMWAWGTAMEACVALGRTEEAHAWLERYIQAELADAFELTSTYRQLTEVWQLDVRDDPAGTLLPPLKGALLDKTGGVLELKPTRKNGGPAGGPANNELQAIYGEESGTKAKWFDNLLRQSEAVARIETEMDYVGTGFLITGEHVSDDWKGKRLLVTNAHVVDDPPHSNGISSQRARVHFTRYFTSRDADPFTVERLWSCRDLDVSILEMRDRPLPPELEPLPLGTTADITRDDDTPRLWVLGHPQGRDLTISAFNNRYVGQREHHIQYKSPTEPGSSGSPVLTRDLAVVAIHRQSNRPYAVNEGIAIDALREKLS